MPDRSTGDKKLSKAAATGQDNTVVVAPFRVRLKCPDRWDPNAGKLPVFYSVHDPNARIRRGRVSYGVPHDKGTRTVHETDLPLNLLTHGTGELLPDSISWDGVIATGLPKRRGEKVMADLSQITVEIEVWSTDNEDPGTPLKKPTGRTTRAGEWYARYETYAEIDCIVKAEWDRDWVVPMPPDEADKDKDKVTMTIEVKNVRDGTPAFVSVRRIGSLGDEASDENYADELTIDPISKELSQPGLQNLVVRGGKIVRSDTGDKPEVAFVQYDQHYRKAGNNFYCIWVRFGANGMDLVASERDYVSKEKSCLHLRFGVFIFSPATNTPYCRDAARYLDNLFRKRTKYWRSYTLTRGPKNADEWFRYHGGRAVFIFLGHASAACRNYGNGKLVEDGKWGWAPATGYDGHPMYKEKRKKKKPGWKFKGLPREGFLPDQNLCPMDENRHAIGGCGKKQWVIHQLDLGLGAAAASPRVRGKQFVWGSIAGRSDREKLELLVVGDEDLSLGSGMYDLNALHLPRVAMINAGCRSFLTTNFGEHYISQGARFYVGWAYSGWDKINSAIIRAIFRSWLTGSKGKPASDEWDLERLKLTMIDVMKRYPVSKSCNPRILDGSRRINPYRRQPPSAKAKISH